LPLSASNDSLWATYNNQELSDSIRIKAIGDLAWESLNQYPDSAIYFADMEYQLAFSVNNERMKFDAMNTKAIAFQKIGNYSLAIKTHTLALSIVEKTGDQIRMARSLNNIANIYMDLEDYNHALNFYYRSLEISIKHEDSISIGTILNNIGLTQGYLGDREEALINFKKSLKIRKMIKDKAGMASTLNNIGYVYLKEENEKATDYFLKALAIGNEVHSNEIIAHSLNYLAMTHKANNDCIKAIDLGEKALKIAKESNDVWIMHIVSRELHECYKKTGQYKKANDIHELYITMRDSIDNLENQSAMVRQEIKYRYEKKSLADSVKAAQAQKVADAQIQAQQSELKHEQTQRYALYIGLLLLFVFGAFMYNRFKVTQKQKQVIEVKKAEVEEQKAIVDEKNEEIISSIAYAKRIQDAILPTLKKVKEALPNSFVLYKPKDIVAGDFYWLETKGADVYFAAADCTGHGVPGAMVSVICSNALKRAVHELNLTEPAKILDKVRELVAETFDQSEHDIKDGMDISFCKINLKTRKLVFSGAHNSLYRITKIDDQIKEVVVKDDSNMLIDYKGDKQPIGKYSYEKPFSQREITLLEGDTIYLSSDGYPDQFGGPKGRKYMYKPFKNFFLSLHEKSMEEQHDMLDQNFEQWRGSIVQIDDVCVIGVKV